MPSLVITLLDTFSVQIDKRTVNNFYTAKARALLAYLAVEGMNSLDRSYLAGLLWPDGLEESARVNLRHALSNLRKTLGDRDADLPYLLSTRHTIQLNPEALAAGNITVDVTTFQTLYQQAETALQAAQAAIKLYHGPFLNNGPVVDSPDFEAWVQLQRELRHRQMSELLTKVIRQVNTAGDYEQAITYAQMLVDHEPWREEAHVQLMNALWHSGQGDAALRQYEQCRRLLRETVDAVPSSETIALYEAIRDNRPPLHEATSMQASGKQSTTSISKDAAATLSGQHNIPLQLKSFFGRNQELAEMKARFANPNCRQLTLVGPGGIGKTQLALEYARREMHVFTDGVWFVSLASVADGAQIPSTIADSLDIPMIPDQNPLLRLYQFLRDKSLLLILDNFEHLLDSALLIPNLLSKAPKITLLVTSRERLNLQVETVFVFGGLDLPTSENVERSSAVALFVDCAQHADASFRLTDDSIPAVVNICHLIDGMPLGIELAAVWTRVLSCQEILENLRRSIDLLTVSMPDIPVRHRCMRALFEESWQNLSTEAQQVFAQASIFRGGCDWPALQQVADATIFHTVELVDRGFLRKMNDGSYQIHELMRQFGAEKLAQSSMIVAEVAQRHAHYYLHFLQQVEADLLSSAQVIATQKMSQAIENIRIAWLWALDHQAHELLMKAAESLFKYHHIRALAHDGAAIFELTAKRLAQEAISPTALLVRIQNYFSAFLEPLGRANESYKLLSQNLAVAREHGLKNDVGWALLRLGILDIWNDVNQARVLFEESRELFQQMGDTEGVIAALNNLSNIFRQNDNQPAFNWSEEALQLSRNLNAPLLIATSLKQLGELSCNCGQYDQARSYAQEALTLVRQLNNKLLEADLLNNLAVPTAYQGDHQGSLMLLEKSVQLYQQVGSEGGDALSAHENMGRLALRMKAWEKAVSYFQETAAMCRRVNNDFMLARCQEGLAFAWLKLGNHQKTRQALQAAIQMRDLWEAEAAKVTILQTIILLLIAEERYETAALVLAYKNHHYSSLPQSKFNFNENEIQATLQQVLTAEQHQQIQDAVLGLDIRTFIDTILV